MLVKFNREGNMNVFKVLLSFSLLCVFLLPGCGGSNKTTKFKFIQTATSTVIIPSDMSPEELKQYFAYVKAMRGSVNQTMSMTGSALKTASEQSGGAVTTDAKPNFAVKGSQVNKDGEQLGDLKYTEKKPVDSSKKNVGNSTTEQAPALPATQAPPVAFPKEYQTETISLKNPFGGGKAGSWLKYTGEDFAGILMVNFPECKAGMLIAHPTEAWGADGNAENHNQMFYASGDPAKQKDYSMACKGGCASIFAPPECDATYAELTYKLK
jgi:hypothetical protein